MASSQPAAAVKEGQVELACPAGVKQLAAPMQLAAASRVRPGVVRAGLLSALS